MRSAFTKWEITLATVGVICASFAIHPHFNVYKVRNKAWHFTFHDSCVAANHIFVVSFGFERLWHHFIKKYYVIWCNNRGVYLEGKNGIEEIFRDVPCAAFVLLTVRICPSSMTHASMYTKSLTKDGILQWTIAAFPLITYSFSASVT